jgi:uncharacterized membrane protein
MTIAPVSYIAPMREVSIVFGAIIGIVFLKEGYGLKRILFALIMAIGVVLIAMN